MQPNEQDQNQQLSVPPTQNQAQPLPYAVPEYLHLDPVTGQAKRSFKKPILIALIVLLAAGIIYASWLLWWSFNSPEAKFYNALDNSLQVKYVTRKYTYDASTIQSKWIDTVNSDLTNPLKPKSHLDFSYSHKGTGYSGEAVMVAPDTYKSLLKDVTPAPLGVKLGVWNSVDSAAVSDGNWYFDAENKLAAFNSVQGPVILGNFSDSQRQKIMTYVKRNTIYTILTHTVRQQSGVSVEDYTVSVDIKKLNSFNKEVLTIAGGSNALTVTKASSSTGEFHIIIDSKSNRIVQTVYTAKNTTSPQDTIDIAYPSDITIPDTNNTNEGKT